MWFVLGVLVGISFTCVVVFASLHSPINPTQFDDSTL